ncbi:heme exporter protein CcmD [Candidatus Methylocalor cossyra]|uniref:Heme exporter protein D n=1 Tax=Candidatus Methylocalor cossyra TaxID=3108543 RepID=A0ABM9NIL6_9GAMM
MNWENFLSMGGYAFYVWTAYGLMVVVLVLNFVLPLRRKAALLKSLARRLERDRGQT